MKPQEVTINLRPGSKSTVWENSFEKQTGLLCHNLKVHFCFLIKILERPLIAFSLKKYV